MVLFKLGLPDNGQREHRSRVLRWLRIFAYLTVCHPHFAATAMADEEPTDVGEDLASDDLLIFEDLDMVFSAARQVQQSNRLAVPVSVVSDEDIRASGSTTIPDVLQFVPGVDMLPIDRNRFAVGVRGLHEQYSDRTLVLIDGRLANNMAYGGCDWQDLPLLMADIDRIEVVRGMAGASWGANAFSGMINIITKKPEDLPRFYGSTTINTFGDTYTHLRWAERIDKLSWRLSVGYENSETADDAIDDDNLVSRDFRRVWRLDSQFRYEATEQTQFSFGTAYAHVDRGTFELVGFIPDRDVAVDTVRFFGRVDHEFEGGSTGYLQWASRFDDLFNPESVVFCSHENDIEGQLDFSLHEGHHSTVGSNVRWTGIDTQETSSDLTAFRLPGDPFDEQWIGLFALHRWDPTERLTVEAQARGDWYSETQVDWSGRLATLYSVDDEENHVLRLSAAKGFRAPLVGVRRVTFSRVPMPSPPLPPNMYFVNVPNPADDLDNEQTWAIEAGYSARLFDHLTFKVDAYYQRLEKLISGRLLPDPLGLGRRILQLDNIDGADSFGSELEVGLAGEIGKISIWYAYNNLSTDQNDQSIRAYQPAKHKVGGTARLFLPWDVTANMNYRYSTTTHASTADIVGAATSYHRLDMTLEKKILDDTGAVLIGVTDVLNTTRGPTFGIGQTTAHETPGRTFFARLQFSF